MDSTREDEGDRHSPKRRVCLEGEPSTSVAGLDDDIWTSIIEFLPIPKDLRLDSRDYDKYDATVSDVLVTWQTLLCLRLINKELAVLLHPRENAALWRKLVLQSFDFSVENYQDERNLTFLTENLVHWPKLAVSHRPSQYGFLTTLQQQPSEGEWPASEDPFTLFGDLVLLLQLPHGDLMACGGEGGDKSVKFLAAPAETESRSAFPRASVMKTLGYGPLYWGRGRGIGNASKALAEPEAFKAERAAQRIRHTGTYDERESETTFDYSDDFGLPGCSVARAQQLYSIIRQHFQDWRSVCCNSGCDGTTPVFFVGESKVSPHRWIGYAGEKTWT